MDFGALQCRGCGSGNVYMEPRTRRVICNQCGKEEQYTRATLNSSGKVVYGKENAMKFFLEGNIANARHYAMEVLNIAKDNIPAMYIIAYSDERVERKSGEIKAFFYNAKRVEDVEYSEVMELQTLFKASARMLPDYESEIIEFMAMNLQGEEDKEDLLNFIDEICPFFIGKRHSCKFLSGDLLEMYVDLAKHCNVPKLCLSLIKAITENPDSPYIDNAFYLKSKTRYFYDNFVIPVGKVIDAMSNKELREKFCSVYNQVKMKYETDAGY